MRMVINELVARVCSLELEEPIHFDIGISYPKKRTHDDTSADSGIDVIDNDLRYYKTEFP